MTQKALYEAARRQPFKPFRLILSSGDAYDIRHPDLIMVGLREAIIGLTKKVEGIAFESTLRVDLLHVVGIEDLPRVPQSVDGPSA